MYNYVFHETCVYVDDIEIETLKITNLTVSVLHPSISGLED